LENSACILLVEDSRMQARLLMEILTSSGFSVDVAYNGKEALDKLAGRTYDAIVLDLIMPLMSGFELCKKVKSGVAKDTPVIAVTVLHELKDLIEALRCGADQFLTKPVEASVLVRSIKSILAAKQTESPLPGAFCDPSTGTCFIDRSFVESIDRKKSLDFVVTRFDDFLKARQRQLEIQLMEMQRELDAAQHRKIMLSALVSQMRKSVEAAIKTIDAMLDDNGLSEKNRQSLTELKSMQQSLLSTIASSRQLTQSAKA
jgi:DNA-binding response OmpR family regulator